MSKCQRRKQIGRMNFTSARNVIKLLWVHSAGHTWLHHITCAFSSVVFVATSECGLCRIDIQQSWPRTLVNSGRFLRGQRRELMRARHGTERRQVLCVSTSTFMSRQSVLEALENLFVVSFCYIGSPYSTSPALLVPSISFLTSHSSHVFPLLLVHFVL